MITSFSKCAKCGYRNKNYKAGQELPCDFSSCINFVLHDSETGTENAFIQQKGIIKENNGFSGVYNGFISALQLNSIEEEFHSTEEKFNSIEEECCQNCESKKFWNLQTDYKCVPSKYCKVINPLNFNR